MLQVRIQVSLLPRHRKLGQVHSSLAVVTPPSTVNIGTIPVGDALDVAAVLAECFKREMTTHRLCDEVYERVCGAEEDIHPRRAIGSLLMLSQSVGNTWDANTFATPITW